MPLDEPAGTEVVHSRPMPHAPGVLHRAVPVRSGTAEAVRLHVAETGTGTPVVLLHGFLQHWYSWRDLLPLLSADYRLICVDLRGFGWSEQTRRGYDTDTLVGDVLALLDALGLNRVHLLGHDLGARVGLRMCLRRPERFAGFLALSVNHPWPARSGLVSNLRRMWFTAFLEYPVIGRWVLRHCPSFTRLLLRRGVAEPGAWRGEDLEEFVSAAQHSAHAGQQVLWQYVLRDMPKLLRRDTDETRLTVPTLILGGDRDTVIPPSLLAGDGRRADDLETRVVPGCGHQPALERPGHVAEAARELFGRTARVTARGTMQP